jgi:hypothetical protein
MTFPSGSVTYTHVTFAPVAVSRAEGTSSTTISRACDHGENATEAIVEELFRLRATALFLAPQAARVAESDQLLGRFIPEAQPQGF